MFAIQSGSLPFLSSMVAYIVAALGYLSLIAVMDTLLKSIGGATRGPRTIILAVLAAGALLQMGLMLVFSLNQDAGPGLSIIAAAFFLAVPVSFAPLLQRIEDGTLGRTAKSQSQDVGKGPSPAWHNYVARNPILPASRITLPVPNDFTRLSVIAHLSPTNLTQIGTAVAEANSMISELAVLHRQHDILEMSVEVGFVDDLHLSRIITTLRGTRGVQQVDRLKGE
jgi:hypothetical protein